MRNGFTLIELITVIAVTLTLLAMGVVSLSGVRETASQDSVLEVLLADIKLQQIKAMSGDTSGESTTSREGIYFSQNSYTLFQGDSYIPNVPTNFTLSLTSNLKFVNSTFPSSQIVFEKGSGEIQNFTPGNNTVTLRNNISNKDIVITINKYGAFTSVQ